MPAAASRATAACASLAFAVVALGGCLAAPGPEPAAAPPAPRLPHLEAPGARVEAVGDAVRVAWRGTVAPGEGSPEPGGVFVVPVLFRAVREHAFALPPEVTLIEGSLTWSAGDGLLGFRVVNASGATWCGAQFTDGTRASCFATLHAPRVGDEPWRVRILASAYAPQPGPVDYEAALLLRAADLPILGPPVPAGRHGGLRFGAPVAVDPEVWGDEPSIAVTPGGTVYIAAYTNRREGPGHPGGLWRSTDGVSFEHLDVGAAATCYDPRWLPRPRALLQLGNGAGAPGLGHTGCGDTDVATAGEDTVYFTYHWSAEGVAVSHDAGATWWVQPLGTGLDVPHTDRQWLVTDGPMRAWLAFTGPARGIANAARDGGGASVARTLDGGRTWHNLGGVAENDACVSTLARDAEGTLYLGGCDASGPGVGVSTDGGLTWAWRGIAEREVEFLIVPVTTDAAGNVYAVWMEPARPEEGLGTAVWFSASQDQGRSWSEPRRVFSEPGTYVFPWATGGAPGRLAVAAYGTRFAGDPERAVGDWYAVVALTEDALASEPLWHEAAVAAGWNQYGPICLGGSGCAHARNLGDFFQVQADAEGFLHVAYTDGSAGGERSASRVVYARQAAGPTLGGPSVDKNGGM